MAKNSFPMKASGGLFGKLMWLLVCIALLMLVVHDPAEAANWVSGIFRLGGQIVNGIAAFLRSLFG